MQYASLEHWVNINSGSLNPEGLRLMADALAEHLSGIPGPIERITLPEFRELDGSVIHPGDVLRLRFRSEAPVQVLFSGHMDTVFDKNHSFQRLRMLEDGKANGPGVTDMKGGLFIMLEAVEQFLRENRSGTLGGEILITADEEIGSPASRDLILEAAGRAHLGLVFESALPGGELVCARKGTGTYQVRTRGKAAHTGRDFRAGRNAIVALSDFLLRCHALNESFEDAVVNVGRINGGGAVNVVPDKAEGWLNVRASHESTGNQIERALHDMVGESQARWKGVSFSLEGGFTRPPKEESKGDATLYRIWNTIEHGLGFPESGKRETGGSSDGNLLSQAGLPHLDGIGIRGNYIHSENEYALLESIPEQIAKTVAFLHHFADSPALVATPPLQKPS
ncbi:hydrolase [Puniceicoccales bacterium CK1056]|uniref:Hydrolase n=1 Tax=Oceanipulchritudo coccoides TaxID=2706888 RepID=A0A6B2M0E0_9BACT|nr:hydrolase [Oceanipulchritudo coccoides]NDV61779.1 hydrolase [Oceanipulchritudo coccoides]